MAEADDTQGRLKDYSLRTNVNAMNVALLDQRLTVNEKRTDEYHQRLHKQEDEMLIVKTKQEIHDVQIQAMRKILVGNGDRETIPMDIERMELAIANILKVDWNKAQRELDALKEWKEKIDGRAWQVAIIIIGLVISNVWQWIAP
jgi:hypothetical protein